MSRLANGENGGGLKRYDVPVIGISTRGSRLRAFR
jgi:hypothetical protein